MRRAALAILAALLAVAAAKEPEKPKMKMATPVKLSFGGAKIAFPADFKLGPSQTINTLLRATKMRGEERLLLITFSAYKEHPGRTLGEFTRAVSPNEDLTVREYRILKSIEVKVAGQKGEVQIQSYQQRRVERTALALYFLRPLSKGKGQIGYALTVWAKKKDGKLTLPVLMAVMKTIELFDPIAPLAEKIEALGDPIVSAQWGYSVRPPMFWKAGVMSGKEEEAVVITQADYTPRDLIHPRLSFLAADAKGLPVGQCAEGAIREIVAELTKNGFKHETLSRGTAKLAGIDGLEFTIRYVQTPALDQPGLPARTLILSQRIICRGGKTYSLKLQVQTEDVKVAKAVLDAVAAGVELTGVATRPAATTGPASRPAPTTVPATVTPTTVPAIRLVPSTLPAPTTAPATVTPATVTPATITPRPAPTTRPATVTPATRPAPAVKTVPPASPKDLDELEKLIP